MTPPDFFGAPAFAGNPARRQAVEPVIVSRLRLPGQYEDEESDE